MIWIMSRSCLLLTFHGAKVHILRLTSDSELFNPGRPAHILRLIQIQSFLILAGQHAGHVVSVCLYRMANCRVHACSQDLKGGEGVMWIWGEGAGGVVAQKLREYTSFRRLKNGPDDNFTSFVFYL